MTEPLGPLTRKGTLEASSVLLALYAALTFGTALSIIHTPTAARLSVVGCLALLFAAALWRRLRWAWWGTLLLVVSMLGWTVVAAAVLMLTADGQEVFLGFATSPLALMTTLSELALVVLLVLPSSRRALV